VSAFHSINLSLIVTLKVTISQPPSRKITIGCVVIKIERVETLDHQAETATGLTLPAGHSALCLIVPELAGTREPA